MEEPEIPLHVWNTISDEFKARFLIRVAFRVRYFLRKASVALKGWPRFTEMLVTPLFDAISRGLTRLLTGDLHLAVEAAIEYWIALNVYKAHSSWLVNAEMAQDIAAQIRDQAQMVWTFIMDREVESPERFEAIQTYRAKRAILYAQLEFVDELFDCGLLEEVEHEHLKHELEHRRAMLSRRGPVLQNLGIVEFLQNVPCFANVSSELFRGLISSCTLRLYTSGEPIPAAAMDQVESFSFHIIVNGILRSSYTDSLGKTHIYHLGRGGIFGLLSALTGEHYTWMGKGYAELNAMGYGPSVLTVPHSTLMKIHSMATKGHKQYQQLELDLFRLAALYVVEYMKDELLSLTTSLYIHQGEVEAGGKLSLVRSVKGNPIGVVAPEVLQDVENVAEMVKISYGQALDALKQLKEGLLDGELVLLPPNARFIQSTSSILVVGSLVPKLTNAPAFVAPLVLPWLIPEGIQAEMEYKTGPQGAIVMSCAGGSVSDDGMRVGADMAPMPASAAQMQNTLFH